MNHKSAYRLCTVILCILLFMGIPLNSFAESSGVYELKESTKTLTVSLKLSETPPDGGEITKIVDWGGAQIGAKVTGKYVSLYTWDIENSAWELAFPKISYKYGVNVRLAEYESEGNSYYALGLTHSLLAYGCLYTHSGNTLSLYELEGVSYEGYYESDAYPRLFNKQITAISDAMIAEGKSIEPIAKPKKGSGGLIYNEGDITGQEEAYLLSQSVNRTYYKNYTSDKSFEDIYSDLMQWQGDGSDQTDSFHSRDWQMPWEDHDWADNYAEILNAYLVVPESGDYVFWFSADEKGALWLGDSSDSVNLIAQVDQAVTQGSYDVYSCQKSEPVYLEKDKVYCMRALHVEETGNDHFSIAWSKPGMSQDYPTEEVPTECLSAPSTGEIGVLPRSITVDTDPIIPYEDLTDLISGIDLQESASLLKTASTTSDSSSSAEESAMVQGDPLIPMTLSDFEYIEAQKLYHDTHKVLGDLYIFTAQHTWPDLSIVTGLTPQYGWSYEVESASPQRFFSNTESRWYGIYEDGITAFPAITTQPESVNAIVGDSVTISCEIDAATSYNWYKDSELYSQDSNTVSISSATQDDSGEYYCTAWNRFGSVTTDMATVTIYNEGEPIITQIPKASDLVYGQSLAASTLSGGEAIYLGEPVSGSFDWTDSSILPHAGLSSYGVTFNPSDSETYHSVTCNVSVITAKAHATITWPSASDITYGDSISSSELSGGSASFNGETVEGTFLWANSSLCPNAGTDSYTVIFTPESNNFSSETDQVNVITQKADATMIWPTASGLTFGDSLADSSLSGGSASFGGETVEGTFTWKDSTVSPNAGTNSYTVVFTPQSSNFNTLTHNVSVVTAKADLVVTWPNASSIYLGSSLSEATLNGGSATYRGNAVNGTFHWDTPTLVPSLGSRSYSMSFTPDDSVNYNGAASSVSISTIVKTTDQGTSVVDSITNSGVSVPSSDEAAINRFVSSGIADGWWDKMLGVYGLYGGTASSSSINWKRPGTYDVSWSGDINYNKLGIRSSDFSGRGELIGLTYGANDDGLLGSMNIHYSTYLVEGYSCHRGRSIIWMGGAGSGGAKIKANSATMGFNTSTKTLMTSFSTTQPTKFSGTNRDHDLYMAQKLGISQELYFNGVLSKQKNNAEQNYDKLAVQNLLLLSESKAVNDGSHSSSDQHGFFSAGYALTKAEAASFNSAVHHLMQALGREGVSASDESNKIITALEDTGIDVPASAQVAISEFVSSGIGDGWWDKMEGIYGLYGGTAESTAINWKNPGTHDIEWSGNITFSDEGVRSTDFTGRGILNGLTYGDGESLEYSDAHFSTYVCEGNAISNKNRGIIWIGAVGQTHVTNWDKGPAFLMDWFGGGSSGNVESHFSSTIRETKSNDEGRNHIFYIGECSNMDESLIVNGTVVDHTELESHTYGTLGSGVEVKLLAGDLTLNDDYVTMPSNDLHGFFSAGYSLTEAETVSFNKAVHKLMQALGRE